jgi:hypothetical protein
MPYQIVRVYRDGSWLHRQVIRTNVSYSEYSAHCASPESNSMTCGQVEALFTAAHGPWFDCVEEMPEKLQNYREEAAQDAKDMVEECFDSIIDQLIEDGEASTDLFNDYPGMDAYHHETHIDKSYRLLEAAQLLSELSEFEEGDDGLWEGQGPEEAIGTMAAYTYGAAVYSMWDDQIKSINNNSDIVEMAARCKEIEDNNEIKESLDDVNTARNILEKLIRQLID